VSNRVLSLAVRVTGDASRLNLTPAERALQSLEAEIAKVGSVFERFAGDSAAAANAQQEFGLQSTLLNKALESGQINAREYAQEFANLAEAATAEAKALEQAAALTRRYEPEAERFARTQAQLTAQVQRGFISQETYNAAIEDAAVKLTAAERAAFGLAARVEAVADAGASTTLRFNELSGVFSLLPGRLGSIAGRISGVTSAGEGLSRVFSGGVSQGIQAIGSSIAALVNPFTIAAGAIIGLGAAASQVFSGLKRLEDRVENLGNLADRLGVSFQFIQVLEDAAKRSGSSVDSVAFAFTRLQRTLAGADEESKKVVRALRSVGLAVEDIEGKGAEEQYRIIGDALLRIEDPAKRSAAAIELFGRSGATLLPFFKNLPKAADDFERFGGGLDALDKARIDSFGEGVDALNRSLTRFGEVALTPFAGLGEGAARAASQFVAAASAVVDLVGTLLTPALDQLGAAITAVTGVFGVFAEAVRVITRVIEPFGRLILPTVLAGIIAINRQVAINAVSRLGSAFSAAAVAARTYATSSGLAAIGTRALAAATRALVSATGIGALAVGIGFVVEQLVGWADASRAAREAAEEAGKTAKESSDTAEGGYRSQKKSVEELAELKKKQAKEESENVDKIIQKYAQFQRIEREFGGDRARFEAAERVSQIEREIVRVRQQQDQASRAGAAADAAALSNRLRLLEDIRRKEQDVASGRLAQLEEARKRTASLAEEENRRTQSEIANIQKVIDKYSEQQAAQRRFGFTGDDGSRVEAATRLAQVEKEIARVQQLRTAALRDSDVAAANAATERLSILEEVRRREEGIASGRTRAIEDAKRLADEEGKRVDRLLSSSDKTQQITRDLQAVQNELTRAQKRSVELFLQGDQSGRERVVQLQQLQRELSSQLLATSRGFTDGFAKAFQDTGSRFADLRKRAAEFGAAGEQAAARLQKGIASAQNLARRGILTKEAYEEEVARRTKLFEEELDGVRKIAEERRRVNDFVDKQLESQRFGGDQQRAEAAQRAIELEREINRVQAEVQAARAAGDKDAVQAGVARLGQLDQVLAKEQSIASGRLKVEEEAAKQREQAQQKFLVQQQQFVEQQSKAAEDEFRRQRDRITGLNRLGTGVITGSDIRTSEGAAAFLQLVNQQQDPVLVEAKLQSRRLGEIVTQIQRLTGLPVVTFGALGVG
jgi:hypothetical protein